MITLNENELFLIKSPETKNDFNLYYDLRWNILRKPYNQKKGSEKDTKELVSYHIMAYLPNNKVIGVGRIHEDKKQKLKLDLWQYTVSIGKTMLEKNFKRIRTICL